MTWTTTQIIQDRYKLLTLKRDRPGHQVWLAWDQVSKAKVIIKTLAFNGEIQWDEVKLFEREIAVLKRLHHPQIPSLVDAFNVEQPHFQKCLVETYIHAPTLQAFLDRKQSIPPGQIWAIAAQVLTILRDLHALNPPILHRDIKPSNILIDSEKTVYLIDLGSIGIPAAAKPDDREAPTTVGSDGYTPMEQFMGQEKPASDLYALGASLMALLTRTHPSELMTPQLRLACPDDLALAAPLRQWIHHLTEPDVDHRIPTAIQALQKLQQAQSLANLMSKEMLGLSPADSIDRVLTSERDKTLTIRIAPRWNRNTIANVDLILLSAFAILPPIMGIWEAIALSSSSQGLGLFGTDLLLLGLSFFPSILITPKLWRNLLEQDLACSNDQLVLNQKMMGVPFQRIVMSRREVMGFQIFQRSKEWGITVRGSSGDEQDLCLQLSALEVDSLFKTLERWKLSGRDE